MLREPEPIRLLHWVAFGLILVISIPWQRKVAKIVKWAQVWIGTGAFCVCGQSPWGNPLLLQLWGTGVNRHTEQ